MSNTQRRSVIDADEIVKMFVRDAKDLFEGSDIESLSACVRISAEFLSHLEVMEEDRYPSSSDDLTMTAIDLLRSGTDCLFDMFYLNRIIVNSILVRLPVNRVVSFVDFKRTYSSTFEELQSNPATLQKRLSCLLKLGKMQMVFIGLTL